jgi:hypothetical protein
MITEAPHGAVEIFGYSLNDKGDFVRDASGNRVTVAGFQFDTWKDPSLFKQITVELTNDKASEALVRFFDPDFSLLNSIKPSPSEETLQVVRVHLALGSNLKPIFKGMLVRVERSGSDTTFIFYDMGYQMRRVQKTEYHRGLDDLGIIKKLAQRNNLNFVPPPGYKSAGKHKSIMQREATDWQFAQERAESAGLKLYVRDDTLFAIDVTAKKRTGTPVITLAFRKDFRLLSRFDFSWKLPENVKGRPALVTKRGRGRGGRRLEGKSAKHPRGALLMDSQRDLEIHTKSYADRRARAKKELLREHAFSCTIRMIPPLPDTAVDVQDTIALREMGELFSGDYICDTVKHDLVPNGFTTDLELYRDVIQ